MKGLVFTAVLTLGIACTAHLPPRQQDARTSVVLLSAERIGSDRVRLILRNGFNGPVGYNLCASGLQVRTISAWQPVQTDEVCTMEIRALPAGQDATFEKDLPRNLPAGEYRYVTAVEIPLGTEQRSVATDPFQVR